MVGVKHNNNNMQPTTTAVELQFKALLSQILCILVYSRTTHFQCLINDSKRNVNSFINNCDLAVYCQFQISKGLDRGIPVECSIQIDSVKLGSWITDL